MQHEESNFKLNRLNWTRVVKYDVANRVIFRSYLTRNVHRCKTLNSVSFFFFFRWPLRATRLLRLVALSKWGRVSLARGQLQVHVCTWFHGAELRGRHRRVWEEPVQTRYLQEYSRILQVSRTTRLTVALQHIVFLSRLRNDYTTCASRRAFRSRFRDVFKSGVFKRALKTLHNYRWNAALEVPEKPDFLIIFVWLLRLFLFCHIRCLLRQLIQLVKYWRGIYSASTSLFLIWNISQT